MCGDVWSDRTGTAAAEADELSEQVVCRQHRYIKIKNLTDFKQTVIIHEQTITCKYFIHGLWFRSLFINLSDFLYAFSYFEIR